MQQTPLRDKPRVIMHCSMNGLQHWQARWLPPARERLVEFGDLGLAQDKIAGCGIIDGVLRR